MTLPKRPLGTTGMQITTLGFGSWAVGGGGWAHGWGPQDDSDSIAAIRHAVDMGINWIDTAAIYGYGHSEEVVGQALKRIPANQRPYVFTKAGMIPNLANPYEEPQRSLRPGSIRREVEASLRRLGVERIDLYQFHWPDETGTAVEDSWAEMVRLIQEGKVRAGGVSNFDVGLLERAEAVRHVDSLQPPFSLINRAAGNDVIPWAAEHDTGIIVYSPMQSGLLTDSFTPERVSRMAEDDWRRHSGHFIEPGLSRNPGAEGLPAAGRQPARRQRRIDSPSLGAELADHRRNRRRSLGPAGRWLDRGGHGGPYQLRPGRDRRRHPPQCGWDRACPPELAASVRPLIYRKRGDS